MSANPTPELSLDLSPVRFRLRQGKAKLGHSVTTRFILFFFLNIYIFQQQEIHVINADVMVQLRTRGIQQDEASYVL